MVDDAKPGADTTRDGAKDADLMTDDELGDGIGVVADPSPLPTGAEPDRSRVAPSVKPGPLARIWDRVSAPFSHLKLPDWNLRTFAWLLLGLIILTFLITNWAPMRFSLFGRGIELPKSLAILLLIGVGFLGGWLARAPRPEEDE